jgi:hypothetical protein
MDWVGIRIWRIELVKRRSYLVKRITLHTSRFTFHDTRENK